MNNETQEWQPMDIAPKDDSFIIIRDKGSGLPYGSILVSSFPNLDMAPSFEREEIIEDGKYQRKKFFAQLLDTSMIAWCRIPKITNQMRWDSEL